MNTHLGGTQQALSADERPTSEQSLEPLVTPALTVLLSSARGAAWAAALGLNECVKLCDGGVE